MNMGKFNYISLEEARTRAMEEKYIVADLRSPQEFYYSHVDNAINVPNPTVEKIAQYNKMCIRDRHSTAWYSVKNSGGIRWTRV